MILLDIGIALFILSFIFLFWTFIGYPIFLYIYPKTPVSKNDYYPTVSIFIPTYNEGQSIRDRLENCLALDYPKDKLDIIVIDSGSTDNTSDIVRGYSSKGIRLLQQETRRGKASAINFAQRNTDSEIFVVTDANAFFETNVIKKLVRNFSDPAIGGVVGDWNVANPGASYMSGGEVVTSSIERFLRGKEGEIDSIATFSGEISAYRNGVIKTVPENSLSEDFEMAIEIRRNGNRVIHEPMAKVYEKATTTAGDQYKKHKRTAIGTIQAILRNKDLFNPRYGIFGMVILPSHKLFQIITPFSLIVSLLSFALICIVDLTLAELILASSLALYIAAVAVISFAKTMQGEPIASSLVKAVKVLPYFLYINLVVLLAWMDYAMRRYSLLWEKTESSR